MSDWVVIQVEQPGSEQGDPNQPVSGAKVCLVPREEVGDAHWPFETLAATHEEKEAGVYRADRPDETEGEFFLVASAEERSTVAQRVRIQFSEAENALIALPGWKSIPKKRKKEPGYDSGAETGTSAQKTAATVSLPRFKHARGAHDNPNRAPIKVLMFPATELVFMATADYRNVHSKTTKKVPLDYRLFANGRRNRMYARRNREESIYKIPPESAPNFDASAYEKRTNGVNPGTVYSLFWCHDRTKTTMLKSQAGQSNKWIVVDTFERQPIPQVEEERKYFNNPKRGALNGPKTDPDADSRLETFEWSALDFYQYLDAVALRAPNSVLEAGFFGHGWIAGPLVWSTIDAAPSFTERWKGGMVTDLEGSTALIRADVDGRQKDWFRDAREDYPNILDAFHEKASFRCWGCNHMTITLSEGRTGFDKIKAGIPDDEMFRFPTKVEFANQTGVFPISLGRESASIRHIAKNLEFYFKSTRNERCIEQGDARGVVAYCGAAAGFLGIPTFGAPPGSGSSYVSNRFMAVEAFTAEKCIKFMKERYGKAYQENEEGYVDYRLIFDILSELPDPGWSTERWIRFFASGRGELIEATDFFIAPFIMRVASGLEIMRRPGNFGIDKNSSDFQKEKAMAEAFPDPDPFERDGERGHMFRTPKAKPARFELRIHRGEEEDWERRALICESNASQDTGVFVTETGKILLFKAPPDSDDWTPDLIGVQNSEWSGVVTFWKPSPDVGEPSHLLEEVEPKYFW